MKRLLTKMKRFFQNMFGVSLLRKNLRKVLEDLRNTREQLEDTRIELYYALEALEEARQQLQIQARKLRKKNKMAVSKRPLDS